MTDNGNGNGNGNVHRPAGESPASSCPQYILDAIYGGQDNSRANAMSKTEQYNISLSNWWQTYSERKHDEDDEENVSDSLLYDKNTLPRSAPRPECVEVVGLQRQQQQQVAAGGAGVEHISNGNRNGIGREEKRQRQE